MQAGGGGGNAEMQAGGVVMNIIPKEGGNTFSGQGLRRPHRRRLDRQQLLRPAAAGGHHRGGRLQQAVRLLRLDRRADRHGPALVPRVAALLGRVDAGAGLAVRRPQPVLQRRGHHLHRHPLHLPGQPGQQVQRHPRPAEQAPRALHRPAARGALPRPVARRAGVGVGPVRVPARRPARPRPGDRPQLPEQGAGLAPRPVLAGAGQVDLDGQQPAAARGGLRQLRRRRLLQRPAAEHGLPALVAELAAVHPQGRPGPQPPVRRGGGLHLEPAGRAGDGVGVLRDRVAQLQDRRLLRLGHGRAAPVQQRGHQPHPGPRRARLRGAGGQLPVHPPELGQRDRLVRPGRPGPSTG